MLEHLYIVEKGSIFLLINKRSQGNQKLAEKRKKKKKSIISNYLCWKAILMENFILPFLIKGQMVPLKLILE